MIEMDREIVEFVSESIEIGKPTIIFGLPTKTQQIKAGIPYSDGGLYVIISESSPLYVGECDRFCRRLTPQHHKFKSVACASGLRTLIIPSAAEPIERKRAEAELIDFLEPVFNGVPNDFYQSHFSDDPIYWALEKTRTCNESGGPTYRLDREGAIVEELRPCIAYSDEWGDIVLRLRGLNVDEDELRVALSIFKDYNEDFDPKFLSDVDIKMDWDWFQHLFPKIRPASSKREAIA